MKVIKTQTLQQNFLTETIYIQLKTVRDKMNLQFSMSYDYNFAS